MNCLNGIYVSAACNWGKLAEELKGDTSEQPKKKEGRENRGREGIRHKIEAPDFQN